MAYTNVGTENHEAAGKEWKRMFETGSEIALVSSDCPEKELRHSDFPVILPETTEIFVSGKGKPSSGGLVVHN